MVKKITFNIDKNGEVKLSVEGASGGECESLSEPFEQLLGSLDKREFKDSYYANTSNDVDIFSENKES